MSDANRAESWEEYDRAIDTIRWLRALGHAAFAENPSRAQGLSVLASVMANAFLAPEEPRPKRGAPP